MTGPPELTREVADALVRATAAGLPRGPAADAVGVSRADFCRWLARGRRGEGAAYVRLAKRVTAATARTMAERVRKINAAGKRGFWQAEAWYLETRFPAEFGSPRREMTALRRQMRELTVGVGRFSEPLSGPPGAAGPVREDC